MHIPQYFVKVSTSVENGFDVSIKTPTESAAMDMMKQHIVELSPVSAVVIEADTFREVARYTAAEQYIVDNNLSEEILDLLNV